MLVLSLAPVQRSRSNSFSLLSLDYDPEDMGGDSLSSRRNADSDMESDEEGGDENTGREHYVAVG